jgi:sporulation protein YlmC with PRC-barrel domain
MNPKELFGREVLDANARSVGRVSDIDFDMSKGVVNHLVVKAGPIKKHTVTFDNIAKVGDKVILKVTQQTLDRLA